jgi:hypothetical protein
VVQHRGLYAEGKSADADLQLAVEGWTFARQEGIGLGGSRNYLAINEVDDLGDGRAHVRVHARYDLPSESSVEGTRAQLEDIYERGIIRAIAQYIQDRR